MKSTTTTNPAADAKARIAAALDHFLALHAPPRVGIAAAQRHLERKRRLAQLPLPLDGNTERPS